MVILILFVMRCPSLSAAAACILSLIFYTILWVIYVLFTSGLSKWGLEFLIHMSLSIRWFLLGPLQVLSSSYLILHLFWVFKKLVKELDIIIYFVKHIFTYVGQAWLLKLFNISCLLSQIYWLIREESSWTIFALHIHLSILLSRQTYDHSNVLIHCIIKLLFLPLSFCCFLLCSNNLQIILLNLSVHAQRIIVILHLPYLFLR
jgi:hypothetical protein